MLECVISSWKILLISETAYITITCHNCNCCNNKWSWFLINFVISLTSSHFLYVLPFSRLDTISLLKFRLSQHLILCCFVQVPLLLDLVSKLLFLTSCTFTQTLACFFVPNENQESVKKVFFSEFFVLFWLFQTKGIIFVKIECNITQPINELSLDEALEQ